MTPEEQRIIDEVTAKLVSQDEYVVLRRGQQTWVVATRHGTVVTGPINDEQDAEDRAKLYNAMYDGKRSRDDTRRTTHR